MACRDMSSRGEALRRTEKEIMGEKAATLGRAGERLEAALRTVAGIRRMLEAAREPATRQRLLGEYESARARALEARRTLLIQREAIGLRSHRVVELQFPEPPRLRSAAPPP